jgi:hypothetical protein
MFPIQNLTLTTLSRRIPKTMESPSGTLEKRERVVLAISFFGRSDRTYEVVEGYSRYPSRKDARSGLSVSNKAQTGSAIPANVNALEDNQKGGQGSATGKHPINAYTESASESDPKLPGTESTAQKEPSISVKSDTGSGTGKMRKGTDLSKAAEVNPERNHEMNSEVILIFIGVRPFAYFDESMMNLDSPPLGTFREVRGSGVWDVVPEPMASKYREQVIQLIPHWPKRKREFNRLMAAARIAKMENLDHFRAEARKDKVFALRGREDKFSRQLGVKYKFKLVKDNDITLRKITVEEADREAREFGVRSSSSGTDDNSQ